MAPDNLMQIGRGLFSQALERGMPKASREDIPGLEDQQHPVDLFQHTRALDTGLSGPCVDGGWRSRDLDAAPGHVEFLEGFGPRVTLNSISYQGTSDQGTLDLEAHTVFKDRDSESTQVLHVSYAPTTIMETSLVVGGELGMVYTTQVDRENPSRSRTQSLYFDEQGIVRGG